MRNRHENGPETVETEQQAAVGPWQSSPNGQTSESELEGQLIWEAMLMPDETAATFGERWGGLKSYYLGAYETYRVPVHVQDVVLTGTAAVAYAIGEVPGPSQEGMPTSFFDALAKSRKPLKHNNRVCFADLLMEAAVYDYAEKFAPWPEPSMKSKDGKSFVGKANGEHFAAIRKAFEDTSASDPTVPNMDKFLIRTANALLNSEDMRRKSKAKGSKAPETETAAPKPTISITSAFAAE